MSNYRNKEWLKQEYIQEGKKIIEIATAEGRGPETISIWLRHFGIKIRRQYGKPCSVETRAKIAITKKGECRGEKNTQWNGGRRKHSDGYIEEYAPDHPNADANSCMMKHRLIAEKALGRHLTKKEIVHHINEDRADNRKPNLLICTRGYHQGLHAKMRKAAKNG